MSFFKQTFFLLWKNFVLHMRNPKMTFIECLLPTLFAFLILILKITSKKENKEATFYQRLPAIANMSSSEVGYFPVIKATTDVMTRAIGILCQSQGRCVKDQFKTIPFTSSPSAEKYFDDNSMRMNYLVDFGNPKATSSILQAPLKVTIRPYRKVNQIWHTDETFPFDIKPEPRGDAGDHEMAYFQTVIGQAIISHWAKSSIGGGGNNDSTPPSGPSFSLSFLRFPSLPYVADEMYETLRVNLTLFIVLGFMMSVFMDTKNIVTEKELQIKESMRLMGMGLTAYWTSWFITCLLFLLPALVLYTVVLGVDLTGKGPMLPKTDTSVIFVFLMCYSLALISFSFMISTFVQKGNDGAIAAGLLFLIMYVPYEILQQRFNDLTFTGKIAACLSFNVAMGFANFLTLRREVLEQGYQWSSIDESPTAKKDDLTMLHCLLMLLLDTFLHLLVTWYVDNVFPGDYGVPKPYCFFLQNPFTKRKRPFQQRRRTTRIFPMGSVESKHFEREPVDRIPGIHIMGLRKEFGRKVSVNDLKLKLFEGQITVLLGHNGAGKTTTMSMLTGFIPPTRGTALINGCDIQTNIEGVRKSLGLCPQHDILFDSLTPREHLWFFAKLKGYTAPTLNNEITTLLDQLGLGGKGSNLVGEMSGGEKRSVSVGIALIGNSKVVILDEPSSGMDPSTRRLTWDVLKAHRENRTILLCTHYMDEADALGDRIAIMAQGSIQCCGTSMFLKKIYGTGYHLVIVKEIGCVEGPVTAVVKSHIPDAQFEYANNAEASYLLPDTQCHKFPDLFRELSEKKIELKILGFGTTETTMEEVFLSSELESQGRNSEVSDVPSSVSIWSYTEIENDINELNQDIRYLKGRKLRWAQFRILFYKRLLVAWRHWPTTLLNYMCPAIFLLLYIFIDESVVKYTDRVEPSFDPNLDQYGKTTVLYAAQGDGLDNLLTEYKKVVGSDHDTEQLKDLTISSMQQVLLEKEAEVGKFKFNAENIVGAVFTKIAPQNSSLVGSNASATALSPIDMLPPGDHAIALYNGEPYHSLFVSIELILNAYARYYLGPSYQLSTLIHPLPKKGESEITMIMRMTQQSGFFVGLFIGIGMSLYTSLVAHFLLRERNTGVKHMHAIQGVTMTMYWLPTFTWDAVSFIVPTIILFAIFSVFHKDEFLDGNNWLLVIFVIAVYVCAALPFVYAMQFLFDSPSSGLVGVTVFRLFAVMVGDIVVHHYTFNAAHDHLRNLLDWIFSAFVPTFNLSQCFRVIHTNFKAYSACEPLQDDCKRGIQSLCCVNQPAICKSVVPGSKCYKWSTDYLDWEKDLGIGTYLFCMVIQAVVGWLTVFIVEYRLICKIAMLCMRPKANGELYEQPLVPLDEDDVIKERETLLGADPQNPTYSKSLLIRNLYKRYGTTHAVDHICVGVHETECFGLLGQSGAGKTTTFRMLTGETNVTSGNAYIMGKNVRYQLREVQSHIGYCPQSNAHIGELTGRETLHMYCRIRGVPSDKIDSLVHGILELCLLEKHADKMCGKYSGGNRRKLSLAMALVGNPPFILLDEPSSGMDPKARRQIWNVLSYIRASGRTLILTSQSMEECDALCTRLAIMLNGHLVCVGSPQHLKNKYGQGYTLIVKMKTDPDGQSYPTEQLVQHIRSVIPNTDVFDEHEGYLHLNIPDAEVKLADVFALMETCKQTMQVEDYSVQETTLEQIFLAFTKRQAQNPEEEIINSCWFLQAGFFGDNLACW